MSTPRRFYWKRCYELGGDVHWALCDTHSDENKRVTCFQLVSIDSHSSDFDEAFFPKLIVKLLNAHYEQNSKQ